ncbi:MAG TPA: DCC1-like thiol-disulfide oxidoreductase family protein [Fibrobacteria bacterium]|nr:DCC1-like thiol-disulfide oxidoreductase family protein [Fibrobacteria bacterium]
MGIVLFDGECGFCRSCIGWASRRLTGASVSFVPRDSPAGRRILDALGLGRAADSVVFVEGPVAHVRSDAVIALLGRCRMPWRMATSLRYVPRPWRDCVYGLVARCRRLRFFGKRECAVVPG